MRFTIAKKLGFGFGTVVLLMAVTFVFGLLASSNVRESQESAREAGKSATFMLEKVVDHYKWLDAVNAAIVENHDEIDVQLDPKLCDLGQFLYSERAARLADTSPKIAQHLEDIKQPHAELHDTAHRISELWRPRHVGLAEKLWEVREAHGTWARLVAQAIARNADDLDVQMDATQCGYGEFLRSDEYRRWASEFPELRDAVETTLEPHRRLHESARDIKAALQAGQNEEARRVFEGVSLPALDRVGRGLDNALAAEQAIINGQEHAKEILTRETAARLQEVQSELGALRDTLDQRVAEQQDLARAALTGMTRNNLILTLVAAAIAVAAGFLVARTIVKGARSLLHSFEKVGHGDLAERCDINSRDELGDLAKGFNDLTETLDGVLTEVDGASREVASAATQIAASSEEMATGMSEQSSQVNEISSAIEEMSASITEVAHKSRDAAEKANHSGDTAREGGSIVDQTVTGMNGISEAVSTSAVAVQELGKRGEQIGEVIEVINDIADQTNLLALNAAIEAARAGEHGRGFAVVADEVRKLADRTTKATEEVAQSINAIQTETQTAVEKMQAGTEQVGQGVELANKAGASLQEIVSGAGDVAGLVQSIAAAAEQQSSASEEVSRNVESITAVTSQATEGAQQSAAASAQLSSKAEQLQQLVGRFTLSQSQSD